MNRPKDVNSPSPWNVRIWDKKNEQWLCSDNPDTLPYYGFDIRGGEVTAFQGIDWIYKQHERWNDFIWERSTGLQDKNGVEIYEGDIVFFFTEHFDMATGGFDGEDEHNATVEWFDSGFAFMDKIPYDPNIECEVIGNIYENANLLKEVKDD